MEAGGIKLMLGVGTVHMTKERRGKTNHICLWSAGHPGFCHSALGQRGLHLLQQAAEQRGITAFPIY